MKKEIDKIKAANKGFEDQLNDLYFKHCTKKCVNPKCGVRITIDQNQSDCPNDKMPQGLLCARLQCPLCFTYMCWSCGEEAKGTMHFKQKEKCI